MCDAVKERGMWNLVAKSGDDATERMVSELAGNEDPSLWDPLMAMNWNFFHAALEYGGFGVMETKEDGSHYCPLCLAKEHGEEPETDREWISGCADSMLSYAREAGLVPREQ